MVSISYDRVNLEETSIVFSLDVFGQTEEKGKWSTGLAYY